MLVEPLVVSKHQVAQQSLRALAASVSLTFRPDGSRQVLLVFRIVVGVRTE